MGTKTNHRDTEDTEEQPSEGALPGSMWSIAPNPSSNPPSSPSASSVSLWFVSLFRGRNSLFALLACTALACWGGDRDDRPRRARPSVDAPGAVEVDLGDPRDQRNYGLQRAARIARQDLQTHIVAGEAPAPDELEAMTAELEALGYVDGLVDAGDRPSNLTVRDPARALGGHSLYTPASEPIAVLIDAEGREVWRWSFRILDAWPDLQGGQREANTEGFRRALLLPGGDLIGIWSGYGIVRIDRYSRLKWAHLLAVHHDLEVQADGSIVVLTNKAHLVPRIRTDAPILEDFVTVLEPDGAVRSTFSVLEAFERSPAYDTVWPPARRHGSPDIFHTNSLQVLDGRLAHLGPAFKQGNLLTSMRHLHTVAIIDPEDRSVVWHLRGGFRAQHDPRVVDPARILVFDNKGLGEGRSRLLEFNARTRQVVWSYEGDAEHPFYTPDCGHAQRLANGNTLVNESAEGRAFEITPAGEIVWEYRTPHRVGAGKVSRFYEFRRMEPDFDLSWRVGAPRVLTP
jgi:hypothetical protein